MALMFLNTPKAFDFWLHKFFMDTDLGKTATHLASLNLNRIIFNYPAKPQPIRPKIFLKL